MATRMEKIEEVCEFVLGLDQALNYVEKYIKTSLINDIKQNKLSMYHASVYLMHVLREVQVREDPNDFNKQHRIDELMNSMSEIASRS